ncbi:hypothetical protein JCM11491_006991 [Sporobolomyces phaffii]
MPKSAKHKKERAADFKKAKLKLGKGKQIANNATNTSFSAKTIALPNQSLHEAPKDVPTSRRNLTLPELLVQSRHYSTPVKREALTEILQLVSAHPFLLNQNLLALVTSIAHLIADASPSVRLASRNLLRHIVDSLPGPSVVSVSQGLVLFTLSALSNLDETIRIDALKVLDLLTDKIPEEIVRGWDGGADVHAQLGKSAEEKGTGTKVVEGLLGMLKIRNPALMAAQGNFTSASSSDLSPSARLAVLSTLAAFLRTSLSPVASTSTAPPPWYLASSFESPRAYSSFVGSFGSNSASPVVDTDQTRSVAIESFEFALADPSNDLALSSFGLYIPASTPVASTSTAPPQTLLSLLHPTLLSSFLDAAPAAFSPTPALGQSAQAASAELETITAVLRVARELFYRDLGANASSPAAAAASDSTASSAAAATTMSARSRRLQARKLLFTLLNHAAPYFPFGSDELHARTGVEDDNLLQLNLTFAELVSLLVLSEDEEQIGGGGSGGGTGGRTLVDATKNKGSTKKSSSSKAATDASKVALILATVQDWVVAALECTLTSASHPLGLAPLSLDAFCALEPTLWSLLNQKKRDKADASVETVWNAVLTGWSKMGKETEAKRRVFEFIARGILIQSDPAYTDRFELETPTPTRSGAGRKVDKTEQWVVGLPKWLWELGTKQVDTTELVIAFLLKLAQQQDKGVLSPSTLASLAPVLIPFFHLSHPSRGALPGPFTRLAPRVQAKCLDLASYLVVVSSEGPDAEGEGRDKLRQSVERAIACCKGENAERLSERWRATAV